jgi:hypothetical protein
MKVRVRSPWTIQRAMLNPLGVAAGCRLVLVMAFSGVRGY